MKDYNRFIESIQPLSFAILEQTIIDRKIVEHSLKQEDGIPITFKLQEEAEEYGLITCEGKYRIIQVK